MSAVEYTPPVQLKRCSKCTQWLPATLQYFYNNITRLTSECRPCRRFMQNANRQANLAHYRAYGKKRQPYQRQWRAKHRAHINACLRRRKKSNPEKHALWNITGKARRRAALLQAPVNDLTLTQWEQIKAHYGHRCVYCSKKPKTLEMDHITPLSKGGSHTVSNVVPACRTCNSKKHAGPVLCPVQPLLLC